MRTNKVKMMWRGGTSRELHYPDPGGTKRLTACGEWILLEDPGPMPSGKYTNCPRCRSALGQ